MDRASDSGSEGWGFESLPACHKDEAVPIRGLPHFSFIEEGTRKPALGDMPVACRNRRGPPAGGRVPSGVVVASSVSFAALTHRSFAPLLLLSKPDPLRWAPVSFLDGGRLRRELRIVRGADALLIRSAAPPLETGPASLGSGFVFGRGPPSSRAPYRSSPPQRLPLEGSEAAPR